MDRAFSLIDLTHNFIVIIIILTLVPFLPITNNSMNDEDIAPTATLSNVTRCALPHVSPVLGDE